MSIYATLWEIKVRKNHLLDDEGECVFGQGVPAHIGHPSEYPDGDPYASFLPPVVEYDPQAETFAQYRAVVIVAESRSEKEGQRYIDPLLVLSWEDYRQLRFDQLIEKIEAAMNWDRSVIGYRFVDGKKVLLHRSDLSPKIRERLDARENESSKEG